ncbi:hypothetical protein [Spirillospora sp. CA-294931]
MPDEPEAAAPPAPRPDVAEAAPRGLPDRVALTALALLAMGERPGGR